MAGRNAKNLLRRDVTRASVVDLPAVVRLRRTLARRPLGSQARAKARKQLGFGEVHRGTTDFNSWSSMIYDRFQEQAIDFINNGCSVVVSAPTGAGKTAIAEHVITACVEKHEGVIYTAPIKALSNQKFRDFRAKYGDLIGIVTGDVSINPDAPVLIMTTEIFRNRILDDPGSLKKYSWAIYDEIHYIDNPERGTVWEESLILLPEHMNFLCLSATIPNIKEFTSWLQTIHYKEVKVVIENNRPVPLHIFFNCNNRLTDKISHNMSSCQIKHNNLGQLINYIQKEQGFPAIYFAFSRKKTESLALSLYAKDFLTSAEKDKISSLYSSLCEKYGISDEPSSKNMLPLIKRGIGFHHAGMLPALKETIEQLFTSHLLKLIFTTETFALGINMPSRSVIFDDLRKIYGRYARYLKTRDFYQMAGRAGRRGIDKEGFVYCRINPFSIKPDEVRRVVYGQSENVRSQFNTSYATLLNLYQIHKHKLADIYPLSLHFYQSKQHERKEACRLLEAKLKLLSDMGFLDGSGLTEKGNFAKAIYGYELVISELYEKSLLKEIDPIGLGMLAAAVVFEPRKNQMQSSRQPPSIKSVRHECDKIYDSIRLKEQRARIYPVSKKPWWHLSLCIEAWMKGEEFDRIVLLTDTDEGEIIRYFRMSIQVLKEILEIESLPVEISQKVSRTIKLINRGMVDAEKQLEAA